jgi:hypothetical protein
MVGPRSRGKRRGRRPCGGRRRHWSRELAGGCCCREEEEAGKLWRLGIFEGWECKITKCKERGLLFIEEALGLEFP